MTRILPLSACVAAVLALGVPDIADAQRRGGGHAPTSVHGNGGGGRHAAGGGGGGRATANRPARTPSGGGIDRPTRQPGSGGGANRPSRPPPGGGDRPGRPGGGVHNPDIHNNHNTDINIHNDINVDVDNDWDHHWGPDYDVWGAVGVAAAVTTTAVVTSAVVGSMVHTLPQTCVVSPYGAVTYYSCGDVWYEPRYSGSSVEYVVVNRPY